MKKISSLEYNSLVWFVMRASFIGLSLGSVIDITKQDSLFSSFLALVFGLIPFLIFIYLKNYDKEKNIAELVLYLFGKFGIVINIILIIGGLLFSLIAFINLTNFVNDQFLFKTSNIIISVCFIIPIIYGLFKGINVIARTSLVMFFFVMVIIVCIILGVFSGIDINNLKPYFEANNLNIFHSTAIIIAYNIIPIFLLTIIPVKDVDNYSSKKTLLFYFLALLSLINAIFLTITIIGTNLALLYQYPEFNLLKKFEVGDFIDRAESLFSLEWIVALIVLIIMGIYFVKEIIKTTFQTNEKLSKLIIIFLCFSLLFLNEKININNADINYFYKSYMVIIMFGYLFLAFIIMIRGMLKKHFHN